jgi:hypothetical protein
MDTTDQQGNALSTAAEPSAIVVASKMDQAFGFLSEIDVTLPLSQLIIFAVFTSFCLILGKHKVGLLAAYGFLFYWVFVLNQGFFMKQFEDTSGGVYVYGALGMVMGLIGFVGMIKKTE